MIEIQRGPCIRQHCVVCHGETEKQPVQAFVYEDGERVGAICEGCLREGPGSFSEIVHRRQTAELQTLATLVEAGVPSLADLVNARA